MRVIVKYTVKFPACSKPKTHAYGVFDCEFDYDFQEWICSHEVETHLKMRLEIVADSCKNVDSPW